MILSQKRTSETPLNYQIVITTYRKEETKMKQFRIVIGRLATEWQDASDWSLLDMKQFEAMGNYQIEWR